jgi:hypothetical protein
VIQKITYPSPSHKNIMSATFDKHTKGQSQAPTTAGQ